MRDLFLLAILPIMLYAMVQRPFIAVGMWVWTALFFPNGWVYGMASHIRYNLLFTAVAILGYLAWKHKPRVQLGMIGSFVLLFFLWTVGSTFTSLSPQEVSIEYLIRFFKVVMLFVFVALTIKDKLHVDFVLWCIVLSVGFYADLEALKFLASGGHHNIAGMPGHVLGDRNELSLAFVMTLPVCYYLLGEYGKQSRLLRLGLLGTMALLVIGVIGTMSRGGFVAMAALGAYMYIKSDRKVLLTVLIVVLVIAVMPFITADYTNRIDTIQAADEDASFMGRVVAWKLSFIMATKHPFFGGGFKSLEYFPVWSSLSREFFSFPWFYTGSALPNTTVGRAAHSVYFQVLGEQGFVGLGLYLGGLASAFFTAGNVARQAKRAGAPHWLRTLATMLQLSVFSFALGGAALSFAYVDLIFCMFGLVLVVQKRLLPATLREMAAGRTGAAAPAMPPAPGASLPARPLPGAPLLAKTTFSAPFATGERPRRG
ncbi:putative O-glycosylation ligase, exosortase A system-associated [Massilia sp. Dwa41.01b]|uniref:putative O-glycosylation ligase, exosortase A system-associated n=1 Tax=unclassified Massilia TaxID=2609279 RepID=UPI0016008A64|nr:MULTISPECIES: putative O-glycosylation ligase, exosortase A system-associated [unclassified Massilia]QNA90820.1 putative O-glycosylation ligase, exosortase A system-associated [Massilia sp. Dwa41.01b]QNA98060.1 putative O-glycosylation ligase, exosortase A system-associated [Massilia sp. Se16.2.3]